MKDQSVQLLVQMGPGLLGQQTSAGDGRLTWTQVNLRVSLQSTAVLFPLICLFLIMIVPFTPSENTVHRPS